MAEIPENDDCATTRAEPNGFPTAGARVFPLIIVVLAVFPIALGIGFTFQTVTPPPARLEAAEKVAFPVPNRISAAADGELQRTGPDRSKGDDLLREGRYEAALHHYQLPGSTDPSRRAAGLALRIGFCQEGLGLWDQALATYRSVASSTNPLLNTSAVLGQSRIWMRLNDFATAEPLLRSLLFHSGDPQRVPPDAVAEIVLLHSIAVTEQVLAGAAHDTSAGLSPAGNMLDCSLEAAVTWADAKVAESDSSVADEVALRVTSPGELQSTDDDLNLPEALQEPDPFVEPLQVVARRQSLADILPRVVDECGLQLEWSDAVREQAATRIIDASFHDLPLIVVLSALCREINTEWTFQPQSRTIAVTGAAIDADRRHPREISSAILARVIPLYPKHRLSAAARFARAQLATAAGQWSDAASQYSSLIGRSMSPLAIRAAFNAALAYHQIGDLVHTCQSLEVVVHGAPGNELHTRSLIFYGRTLMDRGEFREAAHQFRRAAGSRSQPEEQARAAVFLAIAELLDGKPNEAAESLFAHRLQFQDRSVRNAAALMTSIARWRTISASARDREAPFLFRSVVAVEPQSDWLGSPGQLLLGQAMQEANLEDRMAELYTRSLERGVPRSIEIPMKLGLADYWFAHDRAAEAKAIWSDLYAAGDAHSPVAGMRLAGVALDEHQPGVCLKLCHDLQKSDGIPRADLLKLAGRAYEQSGNPVLAARCYAGQWPLP